MMVGEIDTETWAKTRGTRKKKGEEEEEEEGPYLNL